MEQKINIVEILKDCPRGMELDCVLFENVTFEGIKQDEYPIIVKIKEPPMTLSLTKNGGWNLYNSAKCVIFPKGKTTWEGFVPPCKFKDGDVIYVKSKSILSTELVGIYKEEDNELIYGHFCISLDNKSFHHYNVSGLIRKNNIDISRLATEEEKEQLFEAIKSNGYKWNPETKTLEKLPKFKVGDRVRNKNYKDYIYDIHDITDKGYRAKEVNADSPIIILFGSQEDNYELVPNKFDITTLKPFDKVLVRDTNEDYWKINMFGYIGTYDRQYFMCIANSGFYQCIPYENNEHLLGKTDDCDECFKTW